MQPWLPVFQALIRARSVFGEEHEAVAIVERSLTGLAVPFTAVPFDAHVLAALPGAQPPFCQVPGRRNLVISRAQQAGVAGAEFFASLQAALDACRDAAEVFIIGGEQIYALALPLASRLLLTEVSTDVEGDAFFPAIDHRLFSETERVPGRNGGGLQYDFVIYDRST